MREDLQGTINDLIARGTERGYVTFDEFDSALPPDVFTSEQIEDVLVRITELGIDVVESSSPQAPADREEICRREVRRVEIAIAALRHGRVAHACQLLKAALTELGKVTNLDSSASG